MKLSTLHEESENRQMSVLNDQIYKLEWSQLVGTDLIVDENGEVIGKVKDHLNWVANAKFTEKRQDLKYERNKNNTDATGFFNSIQQRLNQGVIDVDEMEVDTPSESDK